jgi:hypothetical protein
LFRCPAIECHTVGGDEDAVTISTQPTVDKY